MTQISKPSPYALPLNQPEFINFAEERLELGYDYGAIGGPQFQTEIIATANEAEQRNPGRLLPLGRWQLGNRLYIDSESDCECENLAELTYLKDFFIDRKGSFEGFRFKDWADYHAEDQYIGSGDGIKSDWQLRKAYTAGSATTYRPIQKPVDGTVIIFVNGVEDSNWSIDYTTGIISLDPPPPNGAEITATFDFDVPVWFETDELPLTDKFFNPETEQAAQQLQSLFVVEGRLPLTLPWELEDQSISEKLDLGIIYETIEKTHFSTTSLKLKSGFSKRDQKLEEEKLIINLGQRNYCQEELDQILGFFWNAKGRLKEFDFESKGNTYGVRFDSDQLSIKFLVAQENEALFEVSGIKLYVNQIRIFLNPPFSLALEPIIIDPADASSWQGSTTEIYSGSAGGGGGGAGGGGGGGGGISGFSAFASFDQSPPGETSTNPQYTIVQLFWGGGTLHMLVTAINSQSIYKNRLIHYKLNSSNGWNFEYQQATSEALKNYVIGDTSLSSGITFFKTSTGLSYFGRGYPSTFGSNLDGFNYQLPPEWYTDNGLFRFEFKDDGGYILDFIPRNSLGYPTQNTTLGLPSQVVGNQVKIFSGAYNANVSSAGLNYTVGGNALYGYGRGYDSTAKLTYVDYTTQGILNSDFSNERFEEYPQRFGSIGEVIAKRQSVSESLLIQRVRYYCENEQPLCDASETEDLVFFWLQSGFDQLPILIDVQHYLPYFSSGLNYYIQSSNPSFGKFAVDRGNYIASFGARMIFYVGGSGVARDIGSLLAYPANYYRGKPIASPYGFVLIGWGTGGLFDPNAQIELAFIQGTPS